MAGFGNKYLRKSGEQTRVTAQQVEESVNGSLSRLGTDHIDLLQVGGHACKEASVQADSSGAKDLYKRFIKGLHGGAETGTTKAGCRANSSGAYLCSSRNHMGYVAGHHTSH